MTADTLSGGWTDPPIEAALAFRAAMNAMARPGRIETADVPVAPPAPLSQAAGVLVLTLCDPETPVLLAGAHDCEAVRSWITFHTGAPFVTERAECQFAIGAWADLAPYDAYPIGTPEYPDRSATLIVEMAALEPAGVTLRGPGIETDAALNLPERAAFRANGARFPLGWDCFFTSDRALAALPRTTRMEAD